MSMFNGNYSGGGSVPDRISRIAWCRDDVRGGSCVRGARRSRCGYVVLAIGTNGLPVNTRAMASNAPKAFLRAVER